MSYLVPDYQPVDITVLVNGIQHRLSVPPYLTLLELLREEFHLTGVKCGCDDSNCGACTVLLDGRPFKSCCMLAAQADGKSILTVEGLERNGVLHPMQQAFIDHFAFQCGFCTPAMILTAIYILADNPHATEADIREGLHGNLCRCTGYQKITKAIVAVRDGEYNRQRALWEAEAGISPKEGADR